MNTSESILRLAAEGGSVTIGRTWTITGWRYFLSSYDHSPNLIGESASFGNSPIVADFSSALTLLDRFPWAHLRPVFVAPEFRQEVLALVTQRLEEAPSEELHALRRWRAVILAAK